MGGEEEGVVGMYSGDDIELGVTGRCCGRFWNERYETGLAKSYSIWLKWATKEGVRDGR